MWGRMVRWWMRRRRVWGLRVLDHSPGLYGTTRDGMRKKNQFKNLLVWAESVQRLNAPTLCQKIAKNADAFAGNEYNPQRRPSCLPFGFELQFHAFS